MDSKNVRYWPANKVEPRVGLYFVFIAPGIRYGSTYIVPWFDMGCRTRLTVYVVSMTRHIFLLEAAYSPAARAVAGSSAREERSVIPLVVMTPRGSGILSVR